jgi:hypothetical protein
MGMSASAYDVYPVVFAEDCYFAHIMYLSQMLAMSNGLLMCSGVRAPRLHSINPSNHLIDNDISEA